MSQVLIQVENLGKKYVLAHKNVYMDGFGICFKISWRRRFASCTD